MIGTWWWWLIQAATVVVLIFGLLVHLALWHQGSSRREEEK